MTEIKYKLVNGEPICDPDNCPAQTAINGIPNDCYRCHRDAPCIPGLRQQRDEAEAELAALKIAAVSDGRGGYVDGCVSGSEYKRAHEGRRVALEKLAEAQAVIERKIVASELHSKLQIEETRRAVETENKLIAAEGEKASIVVKVLKDRITGYKQEVGRLRKCIREDHPGIGLRCMANALSEPMECGHHVDCLDDETGVCGYCIATTCAEKAEADLANLQAVIEQVRECLDVCGENENCGDHRPCELVRARAFLASVPATDNERCVKCNGIANPIVLIDDKVWCEVCATIARAEKTEADLADAQAVIEQKIAASELHGKMQIAETRRAVETENKLIAAEAVIEQAMALMCRGKCSRNCCSYKARALIVSVPATCTWTWDDDGFWKSKCGETWFFDSGTPVENNMRFCMFCGRRVEIATEGGEG